MLWCAGCATVHGQSANYSPSPSIVERIKEQTLSDHGVNVTEHVPSATNASEAVQNLTGETASQSSLWCGKLQVGHHMLHHCAQIHVQTAADWLQAYQLQHQA